LNVNSVWDFAGLTDSVVVAVIDDGVTTHTGELPSERVLPGYDFGQSTPGPSPAPGPYQGHGMACAGLIAATHYVHQTMKSGPDVTGIISIDPHVKVLPVKIADDYGTIATPSRQAEAISYAWQHGAAVLSNSWGSAVYFDAVVVAIDSAATYGRSGLGSVVVFASGNDAITYPDSIPPYACHPLTLAVGASDPFDDRIYFSMYGDELDLLAPGSMVCYQGDIWSLDQVDDLGVNPFDTLVYCGDNEYPDTITWDCPALLDNDQDFDCRFGGTSAAAPIVAGVASLVLARDPDMPRESDTSDYSVYGVLRGSAVKLSDTIPHPKYGYGRVDAYRAILSIARGDANNDADITVSDVSFLIAYMYEEPGQPPWPDSLLGDANCNGTLTIGDIALLIDHLFITGAPIPLPCFEFNDPPPSRAARPSRAYEGD
jgi:subtilisin family serine protease